MPLSSILLISCVRAVLSLVSMHRYCFQGCSLDFSGQPFTYLVSVSENHWRWRRDWPLLEKQLDLKHLLSWNICLEIDPFLVHFDVNAVDGFGRGSTILDTPNIGLMEPTDLCDVKGGQESKEEEGAISSWPWPLGLPGEFRALNKSLPAGF